MSIDCITMLFILQYINFVKLKCNKNQVVIIYNAYIVNKLKMYQKVYKDYQLLSGGTVSLEVKHLGTC